MLLSLNVVLFLIIYLVVLIGIPVLIGVYVYRDASQRGMNAVLWTLVAVLAPVFVGLIIYLLVRSSYADLQCPSCAAPVTEQYLSCPRCGARLKATCPSCSAPVEPDWKVCPHCGNPLPEFGEGFTPPVRRQDKTLWKILLVVILIPVLFILAIFLILSFSTASNSAHGAGVTSMPVGEYLNLAEDARVKVWFDNLDREKEVAHVLCHTEPSGDETQVQYLVYLPEMVDQSEIRVSSSSGLFGGAVLGLEMPTGGERTGEYLVLATCTGDRAAKLEITSNGVKIPCEVTEVDYSVDLSE